MPEITANGITIHYDEHGPADAEPMLLIMGLGAQMILWPMELVEALAGHGFRVIRHDNRDIGLSHKFDGAKAPGAVRHTLMRKIGLRPSVPYTLADMAEDSAGVLDALGIESAHVVGGSMGGMIAQHLAAKHPEKVRSLTSIFSTTGNPKLPSSKRGAIKALTQRPASVEEEELVKHGKNVARVIGSPGFPAPDDRLDARTRALVQRSVYLQGPVRQMAAIIDDGERTRMLRQIKAPTLVLHGDDDPLIPVAHGHATAAAIPGAKIRTIPGWGHDIPLELVDELADEIARHARAV
ncbi:alpha/beta fold hydrolase [Aurantiacibacter zhengii]|uniref:Alpha/beta fold hydrolase n=1 Tax=Aurantiacibacter zhengii TaxID=2307003 RepID=A0A418NP62_9SPHN|nr:alpha/beta fold hydrolase [Aurantiacibacter zhengii]RIV83902.1 alpha/beta fold hydrolase [Aurantiacibacter zhengii]